MAPRRDVSLQGRILTRGLQVSDEEAASFPFDYTDIHLTQLLILPEGPRTYGELSAELGITETALRQRLLDQVRCAWIASQLDTAVQSQLGRVHAAVYLAAIRTGDQNRARYLDLLYGKGPKDTPQQVHLHQHNHIDLSGLDNDQLKKFIQDRHRKLRGVLEENTESTTDSQ